jgi:hypothetical protein
MHRMSIDAVNERVEKARELVKSGLPRKKACEQAGVAYSTFLAREGKTKEYKPRGVKKSPPSILRVSELPVMEKSDKGQLFMIFGSPEMLASFARSFN